MLTTVSYVHPDNRASHRVAEKLGGRPGGVIELLDHGPHFVVRYG